MNPGRESKVKERSGLKIMGVHDFSSFLYSPGEKNGEQCLQIPFRYGENFTGPEEFPYEDEVSENSSEDASEEYEEGYGVSEAVLLVLYFPLSMKITSDNIFDFIGKESRRLYKKVYYSWDGWDFHDYATGKGSGGEGGWWGYNNAFEQIHPFELMNLASAGMVVWDGRDLLEDIPTKEMQSIWKLPERIELTEGYRTSSEGGDYSFIYETFDENKTQVWIINFTLQEWDTYFSKTKRLSEAKANRSRKLSRPWEKISYFEYHLVSKGLGISFLDRKNKKSVYYGLRAYLKFLFRIEDSPIVIPTVEMKADYFLDDFSLNKSLGWIEIGNLGLEAEQSRYLFEKIWASRPEDDQTVMMAGKKVVIPRKQRAYLNSYKFSGSEAKAHLSTPEIDYFLQIANSLGYGSFNQILVNWYADGNEYIGPHADNTKPLQEDLPSDGKKDGGYTRKGAHGEYTIVTITLCPPEPPHRIFRVTSILTGKNTGKQTGKKGQIWKKDYECHDGTVLVMRGNFQSHFKHQIPKGSKKIDYPPRISLTFRKKK